MLSACVTTVSKTKDLGGSECRASASSSFTKLGDALDDSLVRGKWRYGYDLEDGGQILLKVGSQLVLVGEFSSVAKNAYFDLFSEPGVSSSCPLRSNNPKIEYLAIDSPKQMDLLNGGNSYLFVYPNVSHKKYAVELERLSKIVGKILVIEVPDTSPKNLQEIRKIAVHEGAHFFGQNSIAHLEPPSPDGDQSSRAYIEQMALTDPEFRDLVQNEFCLARDLFALNNVETDVERTDRIKSTLLQLLDVANTRGIQFNVTEQESYWYFIEGIPQYLEQLIDVKADPGALMNRYDHLCVSATDVDFSLYFLYLGAAILHGIDLVSKEKASEKEFLYFQNDNVLNFRQLTRNFLLDE